MSDQRGDSPLHPLCNLDYLMVHLGRNPESALRLARLFTENYPRQVGRLVESASVGDLAALQDVVHDIRSSCVLFSAHQCVTQARELEYLLFRQRQEPEAINWTEKVQPLLSSLAQVCDELENQVRRLESAD